MICFQYPSDLAYNHLTWYVTICHRKRRVFYFGRINQDRNPVCDSPTDSRPAGFLFAWPWLRSSDARKSLFKVFFILPPNKSKINVIRPTYSVKIRHSVLYGVKFRHTFSRPPGICPLSLFQFLSFCDMIPKGQIHRVRKSGPPHQGLKIRKVIIWN